MAVTVEGFKQLFGKTFVATPAEQIQDALNFADRNASDSWGERRDEYVYLKAADFLETQPAGRAARGNSPRSATVYAKMLREMEQAHAWARGRLV